MKFDLTHYLSEVDNLLVAAGAEVHVYGEIGAYPLKAYTLNNGEREGKPHVYLSTGMHGDEPAGPLALVDLLKNGLLARELSFSICPAINPTGLALATRENAPEFGGLDLNRDYSLQQSTEVKTHVDWLDTQPAPDLFISLHEDWESGGYYFYEINCCNDKPERYRYMVSQIEKSMLIEQENVIDDHETREAGWIYHEAEPDLPDGWPEAIYLAKHGCPLSFTFESPSALAMRHRILAHVTAVNSLLDYEYGNP